jgi:predicted permease
VIGSSIVFDNAQYTIVGIAPPGFTGPELHAAEAWIPMSVASANVTTNWPQSWNAQWLKIVARVKPSMTDRQIHDDLTAVLRNSYTGKNKSLRAGEVDVRPLWFDRGGKPSAAVDVSRWLLGVAMVVLLIACANVANLLLARGVSRRREIAVRLALGVSRGRLTRLLLAESTLLAVIGGLGAVGLAYAGSRVMRTTLLHDIAWPESTIDPRLLAFTALIAITTGLVVGVVPALHASRPDVAAALVGSARGGVALRSRLRTSLVMTQAALSVILLVGAGLFVRSLWKVRNLDHGFQPDRVIVGRMSWPSTGGGPEDAEHVRQKQLIRRGLERVQRMPEVEHAAIAVGTPFISGFSVDLKVPGRDSIPNLPGGGPYVSAVTSDYFATVGARLLRGRVFRANEGEGTERVVVVNETMARALWPNEDAVGKCVITGDSETRCSQVVGIVADARRFGLREKPAMQYYVPFGQEKGFGGSAILVRPTGSLSALLEPVRRMLVDVAPDLLFARVETLQDNLDPQVRPWRLGATMFGIFGALAMIVAAIGLYSVIAYGVTQRRHELGVRVALGARTSNIIALVVRSGMATSIVGVAIGIVAALLGGRFIESLLFDTSAHDPLVFAGVATVLAAVSLIATLVPAGRAARVDPATALRAD